jgi:hypothetical protein
MGSGGVAIAALPTVICLKVPFSDGLGGGRLLTCPASMFSAERFNGAFHGIAITIMSRTDCSDVFFVAVEL